MPESKVVQISTESAGEDGSTSQITGSDPFVELTPLFSEGWRVSNVVPIQAGHVLDRTSGLGPSLACYTYTRSVMVFLEKD